MTKENWVLISIALAGKKGLTPAQLQKSLFLLQKAFPKQDGLSYNFSPYNYGPFDVRVYKDAEILAFNNFVSILPENGHTWGKYYANSKGQEEAKKLLSELDEKIVNYANKMIKWMHSVSFGELISSIYKKYPEYKVNSIFNQ